MDTQNIRSHLLKKHALKMDAHIVLLNRTLMLYLYNGHAKWTLNKGGVRYDSLYSRACHFLQMPEEADRAPSGIWDISRPLSLRMRHRKKRRRIPKEMRRPEAFRGTLGSEDGAELRQKVPGEETGLDALPE